MKSKFHLLRTIALAALIAGCADTNGSSTANAQPAKGGGDASLQTTEQNIDDVD